MWYIGPLLFWACAEMTCGFFILSVTTLPRIIAESGFSSRVKKALGITYKSSGPSNSNIGPSSGSRQPVVVKSGGKSSDNYYKLDEDGVPMTNFDKSESQEQLRGVEQQQGCKKGVHITQTMDVTVTTSDSHSGSDVGVPKNMTP